MANQFQDIESGKGILKDFYPDSEKRALTEKALKRKRKKLESSLLKLSPDELKKRELQEKPY